MYGCVTYNTHLQVRISGCLCESCLSRCVTVERGVYVRLCFLTIQVTDIGGISALIEPRGISLVVGNTFATPYNTQSFRRACLRAYMFQKLA